MVEGVALLAGRSVDDPKADAARRLVAIPEAVFAADPMRAELRVVDPLAQIGGEIPLRAGAAFGGEHQIGPSPAASTRIRGVAGLPPPRSPIQ
jgi:hypothetical protein